MFAGADRYFSESGERRRFMQAASSLHESDLHLLQKVLGGKLAQEAARSGAASAQSPLRIANALLELETTIRKSKDLVLLDFIFALLQSGKVAQGLDRMWLLPWETGLTRNKHLTAEQLRFIWLNRKDHYARELVPDSARVLARHPHCPADVLQDLLPCDDAMLRKSIAMHPNASAQITRFFLDSPRKPERLNLALSPHAGSDALIGLLQDKYDEIRKAAKNNLAKRFPAQSIPEPAIQAAPKAPFDAWQAARGSVESILALDSGQRKRVAAATTDAQLLGLLATDASKAVRRAVASNGCIGLDLCKTLARDPDTETSNNALRALFRACPDAVVEDLLDAPALDAAYREIARHVAQDSRSPHDEDSLGSEEKQGFLRALLVTGHTGNPMIQLMLVKDLQQIPPNDTVRWDLLSALSDNRHLSEAACRKIVADLGFGGFRPLQHCNSPALLRELLARGTVEPHYRPTIEARLAELAARQAAVPTS